MGLAFSPAKFQGRIRIIKDKKLFIIWGQIKNYPQEKLEAFQTSKSQEDGPSSSSNIVHRPPL